MGSENSGRKVARTVGQRKKLSDITNTPILAKSRLYDDSTQFVAQLQEELDTLKQLLEEKEGILAESKRCMEKLWFDYCRKSKQNKEITLHNSQLYKDLMEARDQLKILQHENAQMSALYKACKSEMQAKLKEALEKVDHLTKLLEALSLEQVPDEQYPVTVSSNQSSDAVSIQLQSLSRKRATERKTYREPSLKVKLRREHGSSICSSVDSMQQSCGVQGLLLPDVPVLTSGTSNGSKTEQLGKNRPQRTSNGSKKQLENSEPRKTEQLGKSGPQKASNGSKEELESCGVQGLLLPDVPVLASNTSNGSKTEQLGKNRPQRRSNGSKKQLENSEPRKAEQLGKSGPQKASNGSKEELESSEPRKKVSQPGVPSGWSLDHVSKQQSRKSEPDKKEFQPDDPAVSLLAQESMDRPRRRAVSSVGSYKEPSLVTKMRRDA
ncbi:hypothetical protein KP509_10G068500 [Ceratopteris richardii]|uniref:Shugoshin C-terminal domain-containing protein n=1 Tax=Ceratopteris richardii TaxID=49495 RepID=A0A8T2U223_CERRI|nr:hypothetical protein KP509_10G068500 [Ceratopteris richardii]